MNWTKAIGISSGEEAEKCFMAGFNGNGDEIAWGTPVSWDELAADGRTFKTPAAANQNLLAGICEDTVATAAYTEKLIAYGPVEARTYGVATTFVPGANLFAVVSKTYLHYESASLIQVQPRIFTAFDTNATVDTSRTTIFVRAL